MSEFDLDLGLPPRNGGLTHVIDKGLGPRAVEDLLETAAHDVADIAHVAGVLEG